MTDLELKTEIESGPLAGELAPLYTAAAPDDAGVAAILNDKRFTGYVPVRDVVAHLTRVGKWGMVTLAIVHRVMPDMATPVPFPLYSLFSTIHLSALATFSPPLRLEVGPLTAGLDAMVGAGLLDAADKTAILAAEEKLSRMEVLGGYGAGTNATAVARTRYIV